MDSPVNVFLAACKEAGVKSPNATLVHFFQMHDSFAEIEEIDISTSYLGNRGILALLTVIENLPNFRFLNISDQKLYNTDLSETSVKGNEMIDRLVEVFKNHPTANAIDISGNPISNYAGRKLLSLAQVNPRICRIDVNGTRIDFDLRHKIAKQCEDNTVKLWNDGDQEEPQEDDRPFGEAGTWVPKQAAADLTALGGGRMRRQTVRAQGIDPEAAKNYVAPYFEKSEEEMELICSLLTHNVLFSFLTSKEIRTVAGAMYRSEHVFNECIIQYGQTNNEKLFIIQEGQADIIREGQKVFLKTEGTAVGELELLYDTPAVATVQVCTPKLVAWVLDRDTYRNLVMGTCIRRREMYEKMLANIAFLEGLDTYERMQVADALSSDEFQPGDYIIHYDEEGEWLYIIIEGTVEVIGRDENGNPKKVCEFNSGDHIGELEFLNNHRTVADVVAVTTVTTAKLNRRHFEMCMGPVIDLLKRNMNSEKYEYYQSVLNKQH
eukprot:gene4328-3142_t